METGQVVTLSSSLCSEALAALDRMYALDCADEPDLGHNITYAYARRLLDRLARAEPWHVPPQVVTMVRGLVTSASATSDPYELESQLDAFSQRVVRALDRRLPGRPDMSSRHPLRRAGDLARAGAIRAHTSVRRRATPKIIPI